MVNRFFTSLSVLFLVAGIGLLAVLGTGHLEDAPARAEQATSQGGGAEEGTADPAEEPEVDPSGNPSGAPSSGAPATPPDCGTVLSQDDVDALAAVKLGPGRPEAFSGLTACSWTATSARVAVLDVPASQWAAILPAAVGTLLDSDLDFEGKELLQNALKLIEDGGTLDDAKACEVFSAMAALQGQPAGTTEVFNYVPNDQAPQGINGQACLEGSYYSVQLVSTGLKRSTALETRIRAALATLVG